MPVIKCSNGKWRIGKGKCIYKTKESAESAFRGYLSTKWSKAIVTLEEWEPRIAVRLQRLKDSMK